MIKLLLFIGILIAISWFVIQAPAQPHELYPLHIGNEAYLDPQ